MVVNLGCGVLFRVVDGTDDCTGVATNAPGVQKGPRYRAPSGETKSCRSSLSPRIQERGGPGEALNRKWLNHPGQNFEAVGVAAFDESGRQRCL